MAKTINYGDPYTHRITLRVTDEQMAYLISVSELLGVSPSEYVRMTINAGAVASRKADESLKLLGKAGGTSNENVQTDKHNLVQ